MLGSDHNAAWHDNIDTESLPMRTLANLFLVLFLADGSISLLDETISLLSPAALLSVARTMLANAVILTAILLYLCLGIDRRLPKRLLLPPILFVVWCPLSIGLFPALAGNRTYGLLAAAAQVALGLLPLFRLRNEGARRLTLPPATFAGPWFSLKNTLVCGAVNLFVIPTFLTLLCLATANAYLTKHTAGFMRLGLGGISMTERVYRHGNRTIRLAAMIHVGDKEYYDELAGSLAPRRTIVLAEGVTDDRKLLRNRVDYGRVADFLGLASQEEMQFRGRIIDADELEAPSPRTRPAAAQAQSGPADILRADVDVSAFRPSTILFIDTLGKHLRESPSLVKGVLSFNTWAGQNLTPEMYAVIMDDILLRRNREVTRHLGKALERYETVVIPWGALHMKGIEEEVLNRGFTLQEERERVSIDFRKMLLGVL